MNRREKTNWSAAGFRNLDARTVAELSIEANSAVAGREAESHCAGAEGAGWQTRSVGTLADPVQAWAAKVLQERSQLLHASEESNAHCLPPGVPRINATPNPFKLIQMPGETVVLYEAFGLYRQIFTDGRELPKDPQPSWQGYSAAKWQRDTLVVETAGFNGQTWLDQAGHPTTDGLHLTERFHRRDFGHMDDQITIDDPKAYTRPWTITETFELQPDTELIEFVCENEKDVEHLKRIRAAGD